MLLFRSLAKEIFSSLSWATFHWILERWRTSRELLIQLVLVQIMTLLVESLLMNFGPHVVFLLWGVTSLLMWNSWSDQSSKAWFNKGWWHLILSDTFRVNIQIALWRAVSFHRKVLLSSSERGNLRSNSMPLVENWTRWADWQIYWNKSRTMPRQR